jgi:biopolymer transport protein ExbB/TolQ
MEEEKAMEIGALLKTFIYLVASSLLYPVLFLLVVLTIWILIFSGGFFAEWLQRIRLPKHPPESLPEIIRMGSKRPSLPLKVQDYILNLHHLIHEVDPPPGEIEIENLLQDMTLHLRKSLDHIRMVIRIGPGLGLIGTLIPMGTGLAALGQGDMTKLSSDLVIAFTTTVVGLAVGMMAYFFYTVKRRWFEEDVKNIEMGTEIIAGDFLKGKGK